MSGKSKILIVEDEAPIARLLAYNLENSDFIAHIAADGEEAVKMLNVHYGDTCPYDLVIIDLMLPKMNGKALCMLLRSKPITSHLPIIILSARANHDDKLAGFDCGADDYITKPFVPGELLARIKAVLRRCETRSSTPDVIKISGLVLDADRMRVSVAGKYAQVSVKEFKLLKLFMSNPGVVFRRERLLQIIWGDGKGVDIRTVDVHINRLRNALEVGGNSHSYIRTIRGSGYSLNVDPEEEAVA